jgi:hypothetical protein
MYFFKATLIALLYIACVSAATVTEAGASESSVASGEAAGSTSSSESDLTCCESSCYD